MHHRKQGAKGHSCLSCLRPTVAAPDGGMSGATGVPAPVEVVMARAAVVPVVTSLSITLGGSYSDRQAAKFDQQTTVL